MSEAGEMGQAPLYLAGELLRDSEKPAEDWIRAPPPQLLLFRHSLDIWYWEIRAI